MDKENRSEEPPKSEGVDNDDDRGFGRIRWVNSIKFEARLTSKQPQSESGCHHGRSLVFGRLGILASWSTPERRVTARTIPVSNNCQSKG